MLATGSRGGPLGLKALGGNRMVKTTSVPEEQIPYIVKRLLENIEAALMIDLQADRYFILKIDDAQAEESASYGGCFSAWFASFVDSMYVHEEDVQRFLEMTDIEFLRKHFSETSERISFSYRRMYGDEPRWVSLRIFPMEDYSETKQNVLLFVELDDSVEAQQLASTARAQYAFMSSLADSYVTMHVIDFDENRVLDAKVNRGDSTNAAWVEDAAEVMRKTMIARIVPEYVERALAFCDLSTIMERLADKKSLSCELLGKRLGWVRAQFIPMVMPGLDHVRYLIFTTTDIDAEKRRETDLTRLGTELSLATRIQSESVPNLFPAFPDREEIDVYASMVPAKEVGGDFYDFFFLDDTHFCMVIADVSGKGVPAALFMMVSQVLVKNQAYQCYSPGDVLARVNNVLCEKNVGDMFVSVWLGILDLETGVLTHANAGHENPAIRRADGAFELVRDHHGLVLAAMSGMAYREYELALNPGDVIYVYTDGVPEATDAANHLFGTERMLDALNSVEAESDCQAIVDAVSAHVDAFVGDAEQFDDVTQLCVKYNGPSTGGTVAQIKLEAIVENVPKVTAFIEEQLEEAGCNPRTITQVDIAIDELFSNIAHYAYKPDMGMATVRFELIGEDARTAKITFIDAGKPYNPLEAEDPDTTLSAEEREVGGLGVFIVKNTMDSAEYRNVNGCNILTICKAI